MNKLCVVNYVYGDCYQGFIPLYILSLKESYPEYHIRIYVDNKLNRCIRESVEVLLKFYSGITIIEDYSKMTRLTEKARSIQQIQRCQRWLFYDPEFLKYEAIYIGDIDLMIFREAKPLFEQHKKHCLAMGTPYSNIRRTGKLNKWDIKVLSRNVVKFGLKQTLDYMFFGAKEVTKFSGLHFVLTKEYYSKINECTKYFVDELNLLAEGKSKKYNLCSFNNEMLLRDLVIKAGFRDCDDSTGKPYNLEIDASVSAFRPHHGIHLGIFRSPLLIDAERKLISSPLYRDYYSKFEDLKLKEAYKRISSNFTEYVSSILDNMEAFYMRCNG